MALAQDSSTPTYVAAAANFVTTASFTPPAGAVLVAINMHVTSSPTGDRAAAITDSAGLTWSLLGTTPLGPSPAPNGGLAQAWTARVPSSTSMTATATIGTNGGGISFLRVLVFTGADNALQGMVTGASTGLISQALTTTIAGSIPYLANIDSNGWDTNTPGAGTTTDTSWIQGAIYWVAKQAAKTPAGSVTLSSTYPSSGPQNSWLAFAVPPASIINLKSGVAARNGTNSHTIPFGFTSTSGNELVVIVYGAVTHTATGWTEQLSPVSSGELSVFTKTSAGDSSITVTHNGSDRPVDWTVYELPAGSSWTGGTSSSPTSDTFPTLSGLPGTAQLVIAARGRVAGSTAATSASTVWDAPLAEDSDLFAAHDGTTDGAYLTVGHATGVTATSITPTATTTIGGTWVVADRQHVVFAMAIGGGGGPTTHNASASLAVTATIASTTVVARVGGGTLAATAAIAAAGVTTKASGATLAASATLTAAATPTRIGGTALAASAVISAAADRSANPSATLPVTSAVVAGAAREATASATLTAVASITAAASRTTSATAGLAVTATLAAGGSVSGAGAGADLAVVAAIGSSAEKTTAGLVALAITAAIATAAATVKPSSATLAITAGLAAAASRVGFTGATLPVTANLVAAGAVAGTGANADLTVTANITAGAARAASATATLTIVTGITASGEPTRMASAGLAVTATFTTTATAGSAGASLTVTAVLAATGSRVSPMAGGLAVTVGFAAGTATLTAVGATLAVLVTLFASAAVTGPSALRRPGVFTAGTTRSRLTAGTTRGPVYASGTVTPTTPFSASGQIVTALLGAGVTTAGDIATVDLGLTGSTIDGNILIVPVGG